MENTLKAANSVTYVAYALGLVTLLVFIYGNNDSPQLFAKIVWYVTTFIVLLSVFAHTWNIFLSKSGKSLSFVASFFLIMSGVVTPMISDQIGGIFFEKREITDLIVWASFGLLSTIIVFMIVSLKFKNLWFMVMGALIATLGIFNIVIKQAFNWL